jgi:hypothetical protein
MHPNDHPEAPSDICIWNRFTTDPKDKLPFLKEVHTEQLDYYGNTATVSGSDRTLSGEEPLVHTPARLPTKRLLPREEQRAGYLWKLNQKLTSKTWEPRFAIILRRFLYYFYHPDGTCRCLGVLYLYGATFQLLPNVFADRPHVMYLTLAVPRRRRDQATTFYLSFPSRDERLLWAHWIAAASVPPLPRSLVLRLEEEAAEHVQVPTDAQHLPPPGASLLYLVPPSRWTALSSAVGSASLLQRKKLFWDADERTPNCGVCQLPFGLFRRRHHCRSCGGVFCRSCTVSKDLVNVKGDPKEKIVCCVCAAENIQRVAGGSFCDADEGLD